RIWNRIGRATGAQAISLRAMEFAPGMSPTIRNDECDEILYVLERGPDSERGHPARMNEGQTATILLDDHRYDIAPDTGIYIRPHQTYAIDNPGPDSIVII